MPQHLSHGLGGTDNLLKHSRAIDFLSKNQILVPEPLLRPLLVVDIGIRNVPANGAPLSVLQRVVLIQLPTILPALKQRADFQLERIATQKPLLTLGSETLY